ncbi:MAG: hypothetical protein D6718_03000 [Acidobacteria bacterium]|nr:MAG: hypothetical protein D6718_03000 [Acidobacteriota bacterium]
MREHPSPWGGRRAWAAAVALSLAGPVWAGTMDLRWDPVPDADLAGYRVYYGLAPGSHDNVLDAGKATQATLSGLADCTLWYAAVRAYDTGGLESVDDSNTVRGWPRPEVASVTPGEIRQGETVTFTVTGVNFDPGDSQDPGHPPARVKLSHPGLSVISTRVAGCRQLEVTVQAAPDAATTTSDLTVLNPDITYSQPDLHPWVFGTLAGAITVVAADSGDTTPPSVVSTDPAAGTSGVATTVHPAVTFSEAVDPATVTARTVRLVDADGAEVAQATGSPQVSGAVVTIVPARPLAGGASYHIEVSGGTGGVADLAGNPMASDFVQSPPFTTAGSGGPPPPSGPPVVTGSDPAADDYGVLRTRSTVTVTFDRDMSPLFGALTAEELRAAFAVEISGRDLAQAPTSPRLSADGRTVAIDLVEPLEAGAAYATEVRLAGPEMRARLEPHGLSDYLMPRVWSTRPAWRVEGGFVSSSWYDPMSGESGPLAPGARSLDPGNTGIPASAEFRITFAEPVTPESAVPGVFELAVSAGRRMEVLELTTPFPTRDGGRTVVLRPTAAMPSGRRARITVRTGPHGVQLSGASGTHGLAGGQPIVVQLATEVGASAADAGFGVTIPRPTRGSGGGQ